MPAANNIPYDQDNNEDPATIIKAESDPWQALEAQPTLSSKKKSKKNGKKRSVWAQEAAQAESAGTTPPSEPAVVLPQQVKDVSHEDVINAEVETPPKEVPKAHEEVPLLLPVFDDSPPRSVTIPEPAPALSPPRLPPIRSPRLATVQPIRQVSPQARQENYHDAFDRSNVVIPSYRATQQTRRESLVKSPSTGNRFNEPPPPHKPQAHFFTLPDLGFAFGGKQESGRPAGSDGYCCTLDTLADSGDAICARKAKDALLVGSEGGLDVFRVLPNKLEVVGRLEGLRGSVLKAKILPHIETHDSLQAIRPLVALVIHGPVAARDADSSSRRMSSHSGDTGVSTLYATTVDIYSLQTQQHVVTLYESAHSDVDPIANADFQTPLPNDGLHVTAQGKYIVVSSAKSGEVFVFTAAHLDENEMPEYRCLGKFWTALQTLPSDSAGRSSVSGDSTSTGPDNAVAQCRPILSLGQRWLAIVPPPFSAISQQGVPLLSDLNPSPPGIAAHVAPQQPLITCEVVGTDVEGTWTRLGRQAAQGLMKYSAKGIEMGLQGWKELTNPAVSPNGRHDRHSSRDELFPPTKGPQDDMTRLTKEPALVTVVDLDSLVQWENARTKHAPQPLATFALLEGCSFISFSHMGTRLLTTSRKGESSTIWDLSQLVHGSTKRLRQTIVDGENGPSIKQLQRIIRNSASTVLDCVWSREDDNVALLTAHGTVHLHQVLRQPNMKKRARRNTLESPSDKAEATVSISAGLSPPSSNQGFLGSIKSGWQTVSTQVGSITANNPAAAFGLPTTFAGFREATAAAGTAGSRAVAKGLSQGLTVAKDGASDYWHADDNKIRHKALQDLTIASSISWMSRRVSPTLAITCGGAVHVHTIQRATRRKGDTTVSGLKHERYAQKKFPLPPITTRADSNGDAVDCVGQGPHGFWSLRHSTPPLTSQRSGQAVSTPSRVPDAMTVTDVETNPPYCPFHADARVSIFAFGRGEQSSQIGLRNPETASIEDFRARGNGWQEEPWTFGDALPSSTKMNEYISDDHGDDHLGMDDLDDDRDLPQPSVRSTSAHRGLNTPHEIDEVDERDDAEFANQVESRLTIEPARTNEGGEPQIRINTRRKAGKSRRHAAGEVFDLLGEEVGDI